MPPILAQAVLKFIMNETFTSKQTMLTQPEMSPLMGSHTRHTHTRHTHKTHKTHTQHTHTSQKAHGISELRSHGLFHYVRPSTSIPKSSTEMDQISSQATKKMQDKVKNQKIDRS